MMTKRSATAYLTFGIHPHVGKDVPRPLIFLGFLPVFVFSLLLGLFLFFLMEPSLASFSCYITDHFFDFLTGDLSSFGETLAGCFAARRADLILLALTLPLSFLPRCRLLGSCLLFYRGFLSGLACGYTVYLFRDAQCTYELLSALLLEEALTVTVLMVCFTYAAMYSSRVSHFHRRHGDLVLRMIATQMLRLVFFAVLLTIISLILRVLYG